MPSRLVLIVLALVLGITTILLVRGNDEWDQALAQARSENKPIMLKFGGPW